MLLLAIHVFEGKRDGMKVSTAEDDEEGGFRDGQAVGIRFLSGASH